MSKAIDNAARIVNALEGIGYAHMVPLLAPESGIAVVVSSVPTQYVQIDCHSTGQMEGILSQGNGPTTFVIGQSDRAIELAIERIRKFLERTATP